MTRRLEHDHLIAADTGAAVSQSARRCTVYFDICATAVEHDEIVAEAVHFQKRDLTHRRRLYGAPGRPCPTSGGELGRAAPHAVVGSIAAACCRLPTLACFGA
jgi:hypothetical protein